MNQPDVGITRPILSDDAAVWFSAYGFGWGYRAFAIPFEVVCAELGATDPVPRQVLIAFELGKRRILQTIDQQPPSYTGERVTLSASDFSATT